MTPAIRGVLFDKDGTLIDFFETWSPLLEQAAHHTAGGDVLLAEHLLVLGGRDPVTKRFRPDSPLAAGTNAEIGRLWASAAGHPDAVALTANLERFFQEHSVANARPVTDLVNLFGRLRSRGLRLGLATMDSCAAAEAQLESFGVRGLMDFVCGYDSGFGEKPGPGMVNAFCRKVDLPPEAIAVVGDSPHDLDMARSAGAGLAIGVLTGVSLREVLTLHADLVLESIAELETALELPR
ncbi:MAG: phosphoglycolate phosphatase [Rhodospirillaceae bacterium]|jgi:phosphoglycolate phosphatase|nr:phosphoglycolate phosphatase [Rhodospirillaceae bacterium]